MSRLSRFTQLIFGSSAGPNQIAKYGSLAGGTPLTYSGATITPALVQSLSNYLSGWFGAVIGVNSPAIEDMNALCYLFAYQLTYLMQAGIPEWDSATVYYKGSLVNDGNGIIYCSLTDNNTGNALSSSSNWCIQMYGNYFVSSETALATAITAASTGGGVIVLTGPFTISSSHTIPNGVKVKGTRGASLVTLASSGTLIVSDGATMEDVWFTTALTSGNIIALSNNYSIIRECQFTLPAGSSGSAIYVTGNNNNMYNCVFVHVLAGSPNGINYAGGSGNIDHESVFL